MTGVQHLAATAAPEDVAKALADDGVCIVDDLVSAELLDRFTAEIQPHIDSTEPGPDGFSGFSTTRTGALLARSPSSRELVQHPLILGTADVVLGHAAGYQLHLTQVIGIGAGQEAQYIHRDQWAYDHFPFPTGYEVQVNTIWAMTDFTEENGATRVIPGSNHFEDNLHFPDIETSTVPATMSRGSVIVYTGSLYHGGGANRSDATRFGINITYNLSWLRQEENQYLAVPLEQAATFDEALLRLMGYKRGAYALGYVGDLQDPIEVVRPDLAKRGFTPE